MTQTLKACAVFLFAHQDDETAVFQKILDELNCGRHVQCVFLTTGVAKGGNASQRNNESITVLTKLGVQRDDIYFVGDLVGISDGDLLNNMPQAVSWLEAWMLQLPQIDRLYIPAWEGGHPDHDALHAIGVIEGKKNQLLTITRQYSLYNGYRCSGPLFRTFMPLPENGAVEKTKVSWMNRVRFLGYCLRYPSQRKTWLGLFPMMLLHYMIWGTQNLQPVSFQRLSERPHPGRLYYERRAFSTYEKVSLKITQLVASLGQN